jgi:hypothetical protein
MNPEEMLSVLKSLQEELAHAESIHPDHRKSLQTLTDEIQQTLASNAVNSGDRSATDTLSQRMKESIIEFEVRHPIIGGLVERLTDGLAAMGI